MNSGTRKILVIAVLIAIVAAIWYWFIRPAPVPPAPLAVETAPMTPPPASAASEVMPAMSEPTASAATAPIASTLPPLQPANVNTALADLLGGKQELAQVQTDDFPRRLAATVDNLGRNFAPAGAWPVTPTPGRFSAVDQGGTLVISPENYQRYAGFVSMVDKLDPAQAAGLLARMQPMLESAYTNLGFPKGNFRQRLIDVIDQLLATPEPPTPIKLTLTEVKGSIPSTRPWVRYRYADPKLEALSSGQKVLLRMGPDNAGKVKSKLRAIRVELLK